MTVSQQTAQGQPLAVADSVIDLIGNTPSVDISALAEDCGAVVVAKLEAGNPAGSVKDRIGAAMIAAAECDGLITPGKSTIVEATSGNTGIALAFVCAAKGYRLVLTLPEGMSRERQGLLRLFGATVELVESMGGMQEAVGAAQAMASSSDDYFLPDQFSNPANPAVHRQTTAEEIWRDMNGDVDALVCGVGTGGTITGAGGRLKELNPKLHVVAVEPAGSPVIGGGKPGPHRLQGIGAGFIPAVLDLGVIDEVLQVSDTDAVDTAVRLSTQLGVLAGISGGAAVSAALEVGRRPGMAGKRIVTVIPDSGERYISAPFFAP